MLALTDQAANDAQKDGKGGKAKGKGKGSKGKAGTWDASTGTASSAAVEARLDGWLEPVKVAAARVSFHLAPQWLTLSDEEEKLRTTAGKTPWFSVLIVAGIIP